MVLLPVFSAYGGPNFPKEKGILVIPGLLFQTYIPSPVPVSGFRVLQE